MKKNRKGIVCCAAAILVLVIASASGQKNDGNKRTAAIDKKIVTQKERCKKAPAETKTKVCNATKREIKRLKLQKKKVQ